MYQVYTINGEIIDINSIIKYEVERQLQVQINNIINQVLLSSNKNTKLSGRKPKVTIQDIDEVKTLYRNGYSYTKIKNITGWSKGTISSIINGKYDYDDMNLINEKIYNTINNSNYLDNQYSNNTKCNNYLDNSIKNNSYTNLKDDLYSNKPSSNINLNNREYDEFVDDNYNPVEIKNNTYFEKLKPHISESNNSGKTVNYSTYDVNDEHNDEQYSKTLHNTNKKNIEEQKRIIALKIKILEEKKQKLIYEFCNENMKNKKNLNDSGLKVKKINPVKNKSTDNKQQSKSNQKKVMFMSDDEKNELTYGKRMSVKQSKLYADHLLFEARYEEKIKEFDKEINELKSSLSSLE